MFKDEGWFIKIKAKGKYCVSMGKDIMGEGKEVMPPSFLEGELSIGKMIEL